MKKPKEINGKLWNELTHSIRLRRELLDIDMQMLIDNSRDDKGKIDIGYLIDIYRRTIKIILDETKQQWPDYYDETVNLLHYKVNNFSRED